VSTSILATVAQADATAGLATPSVDWAALVPLLVMGVGALLALTITSVARGRLGHRFATGWTVAVGLLSAVTALPLWARVQGWEGGLWWWDPETTPPGAFATVGSAVGIDGFSVAVTMLIGVSVAVAALVLDGYLRREGIAGPEAHVLMLLSAAGGIVMASANDLIVLFLGLETLSIAVYVLASMNLRRYQSQEAGLKYFVLGAFSSAFFLYGIAMVYGGTGTTSLVGIADFLAGNLLVGSSSVLVLLGIGLLLVGFGFKVAAVPFHSWSPDAYDGAPTGVVTFMASVVKVAAFAGMVRVLVLAFGTFAADWRPVVQALAVLSLVAGALVGIVQRNIKRLLAYSSISHAGFILLGVDAAGSQGNRAVLVYLIAYSFLVIGSFAVVSLVGRTGDDRHGLDDYRGLSATNPALAGVFTLFLLAQAGVPFTSGFYAKFYAVVAAVDAGAAWLAVVAMVSAVVAAFLYLRVVIAMWFHAPASEGPDRIPVPGATAVALVACAVVTLGIGLLPGWVTDATDGGDAVLVRPDEPASTLPADLPFPLDAPPSGG
jgi:NADH-quinone oxidoreductase subunit N